MQDLYFNFGGSFGGSIENSKIRHKARFCNNPSAEKLKKLETSVVKLASTLTIQMAKWLQTRRYT